MTDPPRVASREVLETCRHAGVRVMIVTGDHADTARAVANGVGLGTNESAVAIADELSESDSTLDAVDVVARTRPEQKVDIVHRLQSAGHVVAMTGDGVNDAPALRSADIGVAMGRGGTEVARQAAELVLADDDLGPLSSPSRKADASWPTSGRSCAMHCQEVWLRCWS